MAAMIEASIHSPASSETAAATTGATATYKLFTAKQAMRLDLAEYINPTGFAGHASDTWTVAILKGSTVVASWTTDSDTAGQGTITANTPVMLVKSSTDGDLVFAAGDVCSLRLTKAGTPAAFSPGNGTLHLHAL